MRAVVQRVTKACVVVDGHPVGSIDRGLLVLVCAVRGDALEHAEKLARKIVDLRIFPGESIRDGKGLMDRSVREIEGGVLAVSQFTLAANLRRGRRPDFLNAAAPDVARTLVDRFVEYVSGEGIRVESGVFGAEMKVELVNDGPVTIWLDTDDLVKPRQGPPSGEK